MRKVMLAAAAAATFSGGANAQEPVLSPSVGNGLYALCQVGAGWQAGMCRGYIAAVADMGRNMDIVCRPPNVTNGQIIDVAVAGLRNNPAERHQPSDLIVLRYLTAAFPCAGMTLTKPPWEKAPQR